MNKHTKENGGSEPRVAQRHFWHRTWFKVLVLVMLLAVAALLIAAEYFVRHAQPMIRKRIIATLSASFDTSVELDHVDVSVLNGIQISGSGLRIPAGSKPQTADAQAQNKPLLSVDHFSFSTTYGDLLREPTHVVDVAVENMVLDIPPSQDRGALLGAKGRKKHAKISFVIDEVRCKNVKLIIETDKPGKEPREFDIENLNLQHIGPSQPSNFQARLVIPTPRGLILTQGHFGPWNSENPRQTPVGGDFTFNNADMNTINGIGGTLQGKGHYDGVLDHLMVDGTADVPDFSLDTANHPMALHTRYHAFVDGTSGDTFLDPVEAVLGKSGFTTKGKVVNVDHKGHDIELAIDMPHGRIQDMLELAMKTEPPVMRGMVHMEAKLHIPPGKQRVPLKMGLVGKLQIEHVSFGSPKVQDKVDGLSMRAQGKPKKVKEASHDREAEVQSNMVIDFSLANGLLTVPSLHYQMPGAQVNLDGVYEMDGSRFEFKGHVRTKATASQMVSGWKSWLLKPLDPFLKKNGAGLELPVSISGTGGDVHVGLAFGGGNEKTKQMKQDLKDKEKSDNERGAARRALQKSEREDALAAKTPDLRESERLHRLAVADRKVAQKHLAAAGGNVSP